MNFNYIMKSSHCKCYLFSFFKKRYILFRSISAYVLICFKVFLTFFVHLVAQEVPQEFYEFKLNDIKYDFDEIVLWIPDVLRERVCIYIKLWNILNEFKIYTRFRIIFLYLSILLDIYKRRLKCCCAFNIHFDINTRY